ncbi:MAG: cytochrome c oxidase subunit 3 [Novosphingobium sp.]|nr:cytochrome c oxidase subunit 3 [Novosphingobium sp.]
MSEGEKAPSGGLASGPDESGAHVPGEPGLWILLFGEMSFFAALFASFLYYRGFDPSGFAEAQKQLSQTVGLINTLLLLTSSLFVAHGVRAVRAAQTSLAPRLFVLGIVCAIGFIACKSFEYYELFDHGIAISDHTFYSFYFGLTVLHLGHVVIGTILLSLMASATRRPLKKPTHFAMVESGACFWHMVDLLWIVIFALLYLVE